MQSGWIFVERFTVRAWTYTIEEKFGRIRGTPIEVLYNHDVSNSRWEGEGTLSALKVEAPRCCKVRVIST